MTSESSHAKLAELITKEHLPKEYGGEAEAEATCIFSERGPWTEVENKLNFRNIAGKKPSGPAEESKGEFNFKEDENDQEDLLQGVAGNDDEFNYVNSDEEGGENQQQLDDIKNAFKQDDLSKALAGLNLPGQTPMNTQIDEDA